VTLGICVVVVGLWNNLRVLSLLTLRYEKSLFGQI
jgi:hypothetical protein